MDVTRPFPLRPGELLLLLFALTAPAKAEDPTASVRNPMAVIVNGRNSVDALTREQVAAIYSRRIQQWREVGGSDRPIVRVARDPASASRLSLGRALGLRRDFGDDARLVNSDLATILFVAVDPYSIGYVSVTEAERLINEGARIKIVLRIPDKSATMNAKGP